MTSSDHKLVEQISNEGDWMIPMNKLNKYYQIKFIYSQWENHLDSDSSNNPPDSKGSIDPCIVSRDNYASQQRHSTLGLWHFLQNSNQGVVRYERICHSTYMQK